MTNYFEVFQTGLMTKIVTVFAHSCCGVLIIGQFIVSSNGHSEVFISPHQKVTLSLTYVDTVACVARKLVEKE